jgi:8-oxo-dGTP pyrophosphatase MutT (NUDIX family)
MQARKPEPEPGAQPAGRAIRDAATLVLLRTDGDVPRVLMGQRGVSAVFMPEKFVFPGGAVDLGDMGLLPDRPDDAETCARLETTTSPEIALALPYTAVRELWEETGVLLARPGRLPDGQHVPDAWAGFLRMDLLPDVRELRLIFRAVTPPGRPRRFDARFFLVEAGEAGLDSEDFAGADGELNLLRWIPIPEARRLPLPFITEIVLSELEARLAAPSKRWRVPFFDHGADGSHFRML